MSTRTEPSATGSPAYSEMLPRVPESAAEARRLVTSALRVWHLEAAEFPAQIVISELFNNTVQHARLDRVRVTISRVDTHLVRLAVIDRSHAMPEAREAGLDEENGRGLELVAALTKEWGTDLLRWGKRVWADLECEP
ncbi:ATP-binding protein [Streptomyces sp. NPDC053560]|uniref:ATP-binding protein n=1 Tax=Streptomyces sp. NPDC053560 TaxID=3365711 RepID=UPI0037D59D50